MTIFSGAKIGDSEASPIPRNRPVSAKASIDTLSLFFAASITSWGFLELARDDSAREQTIASRQPRDPQVHSNPPGSTITWPTSPAHSPVKRSEEHTSELQSQSNLVCRLLLEKKKKRSSSIELVVSMMSAL